MDQSFDNKINWQISIELLIIQLLVNCNIDWRLIFGNVYVVLHYGFE